MCVSVGGSTHKHTAENLAQVKWNLMEERAIPEKVRCLVTKAAANTIAWSGMLEIRHTVSGAHAFNPTVKKLCDQVPGLTDIRTRPSTTAKERFAQVQQQMGMAVLKQIEVPTRWNSTYNMLAGMTEHRQPGWVSLGSSKKKTHLTPLFADDHMNT